MVPKSATYFGYVEPTYLGRIRVHLTPYWGADQHQHGIGYAMMLLLEKVAWGTSRSFPTEVVGKPQERLVRLTPGPSSCGPSSRCIHA